MKARCSLASCTTRASSISARATSASRSAHGHLQDFLCSLARPGPEQEPAELRLACLHDGGVIRQGVATCQLGQLGCCLRRGPLGRCGGGRIQGTRHGFIGRSARQREVAGRRLPVLFQCGEAAVDGAPIGVGGDAHRLRSEQGMREVDERSGGL